MTTQGRDLVRWCKRARANSSLPFSCLRTLSPTSDALLFLPDSYNFTVRLTHSWEPYPWAKQYAKRASARARARATLFYIKIRALKTQRYTKSTLWIHRSLGTYLASSVTYSRRRVFGLFESYHSSHNSFLSFFLSSLLENTFRNITLRKLRLMLF